MAAETPKTGSIILASLATVALSPLAKQYAIIVVLSLFGSLVTLSRMQSKGRAEGAWFLFRSVAVASALASALASSIAAKFPADVGSITPVNLLAIVAFVIGLKTDAILDLMDALFRGIMDRAVAAVINRIGGGRNGGGDK